MRGALLMTDHVDMRGALLMTDHVDMRGALPMTDDFRPRATGSQESCQVRLGADPQAVGAVGVAVQRSAWWLSVARSEGHCSACQHVAVSSQTSCW
jgi:hypothetical protein